MKQKQAGLTLVEVLVSLSLFALVVVTAMSVLLFGKANSQSLANDIDTTQQLRTVLRQMGEDLTYANWDPTRSMPACYHTSNWDTWDGCTFAVRAYQPVADRTSNTAKWQEYPDFPGEITAAPPIGVRYLLQGGSLIREVFDSSASSRVYSSRTLVSGLVPYDPAGTGSQLELVGSRRIRVTLKMNRPQGRGDRSVASMSTEFFLP